MAMLGIIHGLLLAYQELLLHGMAVLPIGHLLTQLGKLSKCFATFLAVGCIAAAVGSEIKPFFNSIMVYIKQGLQMDRKKNVPSKEPTFQCADMLAEMASLSNQLDLIFVHHAGRLFCPSSAEHVQLGLAIIVACKHFIQPTEKGQLLLTSVRMLCTRCEKVWCSSTAGPLRVALHHYSAAKVAAKVEPKPEPEETDAYIHKLQGQPPR
ncbi:hypothetical protein CERSUDRAFT_74645 [Gelatoporia subvermispora B]|uniref:Uncharacterized protein n=1 Tax=Ceriporiopsis subvermispora (strain B) TaxID=914234 RepID=M2RAJ9_CERS8|nr:hypothetical protein CERSUDRAFT_74645 [Gelatoporia subvermispora B]